MILTGLAPARRRLVLLVVGALVLTLVAAVTVAVLRRTDAAGSVDQATPGPVVLVPGYGGDVSDLDPLVERVRDTGRTAVVCHRRATAGPATWSPRPSGSRHW